ncbi:MAG: PilN domain-containing protein [Desulfobulbaceae bacterium]|nr:PilN domain-containing protein [Desulfobulbaceae bacterium]MCK5341535.1 PilN domain-containing protein [Desulfobulbaceae bacterium]MCK5403975.1 PilN domain-containing protein [Desulfobulbaceae bacterium]
MQLQRINLVPAKPFAERIKRVTPFVIGAFLVVTTLVVYAQYLFVSRQLARIDTELTEKQGATDRFETLQSQVAVLKAEVARQKQDYAQIKKRVSEISSAKTEKNKFSQVLQHITQILPSTVKCNSISIQQTSGKISGSAVKYGDLPDFIRKMKQDPLFANAVLLDIVQDSKNSIGRLSFNIDFKLNEH